MVRSRSWVAPASCDIGGLDAFRTYVEQAVWADVLHFHFPWPFADVMRLVDRTSKPAVMTYHSDVVQKGILDLIYRPVMRRMLRNMDTVVATSPAYAGTSPVLIESSIRRKLKIIPLGICEESYRDYVAQSQRVDLKRRFELTPGMYMLFVGVLRPYKGLDSLIEAAEGTGIPLVIAGAGREARRLRVMAEGAGNIRFVGPVTDAEKIALIRGCRALVLPSHLRSEAFGMVLVEASMCGRPMISCEIGTGTSFVNKHGETGLVVPPGSPERLREAMFSLLADADRAEEMGQAARRRYEQLFSGEALGRAYMDLYRGVLNG